MQDREAARAVETQEANSESPGKKDTPAYAINAKACFLTIETMKTLKGIFDWFNSSEQTEKLSGQPEDNKLYIHKEIYTLLNQQLRAITDGKKTLENVTREEIKSFLVSRARGDNKEVLDTLEAEVKNILAGHKIAGSNNTADETDTVVLKLNDAQHKHEALGGPTSAAKMAELVKDAVNGIKDPATKTLVMTDPDTNNKKWPTTIEELGVRLLRHEWYKSRAKVLGKPGMAKARKGQSQEQRQDQMAKARYRAKQQAKARPNGSQRKRQPIQEGKERR